MQNWRRSLFSAAQKKSLPGPRLMAVRDFFPLASPFSGIRFSPHDIIGSSMTTGYYHPSYAESFSEQGTAITLPHAGGQLLERTIPGMHYRDAVGCYPLLCCRRWPELGNDLAAFANQWITFAAVTDPFGAVPLDDMQREFDIFKPYKQHFVVDLTVREALRVSPHHQQELRRAARKGVTVERCSFPNELFEDWNGLYAKLIQRHSISGPAKFSRGGFLRQFAVPGLVVFRASIANETVGMALWFVSAPVCYYHLTAYSDKGYKAGASYPLMAIALNALAGDGVQWANLGAGAGHVADPLDGLSRFKSGWATGTRTAYFAGKILDSATYRMLSTSFGKQQSTYFPAYREGEFTKTAPV